MATKTSKKTSKKKSKAHIGAWFGKLQRKKWTQWRGKLLQRVGCVSLFLVALTILLMLFVYRAMNFDPEAPPVPIESGISLEEKEAFIHTIAPIAQNLQREYGVLASISMAQAILESEYGQSELAADYYNLYGVKTDASDPEGVNFVTKEFVDDEWIEIVDRFKVYPSWAQSMRSHAELIYYGTSWNEGHYEAVLSGQTYQEQAQGLQSSGYATDPDYAAKIIEMIEVWELYQYDQPIQPASEN